MLNYIEKLFPEILERLRQWSFVKRGAILSGFIILILAIKYFYGQRSQFIALVSKEFTLPLYALCAIFLGIIIITSLIYLLHHISKRRRLLKLFVTEWLEFQFLCSIFFDQIALSLGENSPEQKEYLEGELSKQFQPYHESHFRLRRLLHLIGEDSLVVKNVPFWEEIKQIKIEHKDKNGYKKIMGYDPPIFRQDQYKSPFSFLLDLGGITGEVNHRSNVLHAALAVSMEYIEFLVYEHPYLGRVKGVPNWLHKNKARKKLGEKVPTPAK